MAHWAELDENSKVLRVVVGDNNEPDEGYSWLINNLGGVWVKTSYNTRGGVHYQQVENSDGTIDYIPDDKPQLRKNYAGVDYTYDAVRDAFIPPKPDGDWILNEDTCLWEKTEGE